MFGPGLLVALVAAALLLWGEHQKAGYPRGDVAPGSGPASHPHAGTRPARQLDIPPVAPAPDLAFVLQQQGALRLSERQAGQLSRLEHRFQENTAGTRLALDQASTEFSRAMQERRGKGVLLPDLQERTVAVSRLSRHLAAARQVSWASAARILTPAQRAQAEALWVRQWERRPPSGATAGTHEVGGFPVTRRPGR